jgi:hypothetical protein
MPALLDNDNERRDMKRLIRLLVCILMLGGSGARAVDLSDHWWVATESGWGIDINEQEDALFAVLFTYGADGQPLWLTGNLQRYGWDMAGNPGFAGPLYRTTGPAIGTPFDPANVGNTVVGTMSFQAHSATTATLYYEFNGIKVTKKVTRLTLRQRDWSDVYHAVQRANYIGCVAGYTPAFIYDRSIVTIEQQGAAFDMVVDGSKQVCRYVGAYAQQGRVGGVTGAYTCTDGVSGSFTLSRLENSDFAIAGVIKGTHPYCGQMIQVLSGFSLTQSP